MEVLYVFYRLVMVVLLFKTREVGEIVDFCIWF